jgi:hypothetical protein
VSHWLPFWLETSKPLLKSWVKRSFAEILKVDNERK